MSRPADRALRPPMRSPGRPPVDRREIQQRFLRKISEGLSHRPLEPEQYTAIRFTQRLADAGIQPSMGSVGDSFDTQSRICGERCRLGVWLVIRVAWCADGWWRSAA
jgi:hypothetical protein